MKNESSPKNSINHVSMEQKIHQAHVLSLPSYPLLKSHDHFSHDIWLEVSSERIANYNLFYLEVVFIEQL